MKSWRTRLQAVLQVRHPFNKLSVSDRWRKAQADSRHFKLVSPALWRYALALGIYQILFALLLLRGPDATMGAPAWEPIVAAFPAELQGVLFLGMFLTILVSIPNEWKLAIHLVVIVQTALWAWWAGVFFIEALTRDTGTLSGALSYGFLAIVGRIAIKGISQEASQ